VSEIQSEKKGGVRGKMFLDLFFILIFLLFLISSKLKEFPRAESVLPMTVIGERSPCPYLDLRVINFLPLSC